MIMNFLKKYFTYNNEYISGITYLLRLFVASFLLIFFVLPGVYFAAISAYKRSKSLKWSMEMVWISTIAVALLPIVNLMLIELSEDILFISAPISIIHLFLLFSNGKPPMKEADIQDDDIEVKVPNNSGLPKIEDAKDIFNSKVKEIFNQFEKDLNAENFKDYPVPYWYDIIKGRADGMKIGNSDKSIIDIQNEWTWMHADEYSTKYRSVEKEESIQAISLRIERFGFIYSLLCDLEKKLNNLVKEFNLKANPFLKQFEWDKASATSSLYGSINFALSLGMNKEQIKNLYSDFIFDENMIKGSDPFASLGTNKEGAHEIIKEKLGVDVDKIKLEQVEVKKRISSILSQLDLEKRYAVFAVLAFIANADGTTDDEYLVLNDIRLELNIDLKKFEDAKLDGNQACDLLQDLNQDQKDELSRYIVMVVGADGEFSTDEVIWVNDAIKQLNLDMSLLTELMTKYWKKK